MGGDYPTEEELEKIRRWDYKDAFGLMEFIRPYWEQHGWWKQTGKKVINLQMSTGGWSGNESIIGALDEVQNGNMFFFLWWQKSVRGGHYWFKVKQLKSRASQR